MRKRDCCLATTVNNSACFFRSTSTIILDEPMKPRLRGPAECAARLAGVSPISKSTSAGRTWAASTTTLVPPVEPSPGERDLAQLAHAVRLAGRDHVVVGLVLLEHQPHRLDVVAGEAPVALGVEVAQPRARPPGRA